MFKVTLDAVFRTTQNINGREVPKFAIKVLETIVNGISINDRWLSTLKTAGTEGWNKGDTVYLTELSERGNFLNFVPESAVEARVRKLEEQVFGAKPTAQAQATPEDFPPEDVF